MIVIREFTIPIGPLNKNRYLTLLELIVFFLSVAETAGYAQTLLYTNSPVRSYDAGQRENRANDKLGSYADIDSDNDGLADFQEIHKYLTDPAKKDTDGDGVPDDDWNERREYTYSVRTILRFMPPFDKAALNDDYLDTRLLQKKDDYIELEIIHDPLATAHQTIEENPKWQRDYAGVTECLEPGITTKCDAKMKQGPPNEHNSPGSPEWKPT